MKSRGLLAMMAIGLGGFLGCGSGVSKDPFGHSGGNGGASGTAASGEAGVIAGGEGGEAGATGGEAGDGGEGDQGGADGVTGGAAGVTGGVGGVTGGVGGDSAGEAGDGGGAPIFRRCSSNGPFGMPKRVEGLPTGSVRLRLNPAETEVYFARSYPGAASWQVVRASRPSRDVAFDEQTVTVLTVNNDDDFLSPTMAPNGILYFEHEGGPLSNKIYQTVLNVETNDFGPIEVAPGLRDEKATYVDESPYVIPSGEAMYFHSGRYFSQGKGYEAIFRATWNGTTFADPVHVDVDGGRGYPVVSPDELTLYLTRNPDNGSLTADIWQTTRPDKSLSFGGHLVRVEGPNLGATFNELASFVSADGCRLYFDRGYPATGQSAWVVERAPDIE